MKKTSAQKKLERRKKIEHLRNVEQNKPKPKFNLMVKVPGGWREMMKFYTQAQVNAHIANMEDLRKRNASDIVEAVIVEVKTKKIVAKIEGHAMTDPAMLPKEEKKVPLTDGSLQ
jgi:methyltransferase-like protein